MTTPNLYGFATKELAQDATIAYILAWADPKYSESHCRLHTLGTELLRSLLGTQDMDLPPIETLLVETQVDRIDILVRINPDQNANRIILIIEDKVSTAEHSNQIERYKEAAKNRYSGHYDQLVAVYLKTGNESKASLPSENICGRFLRRDLLDILDNFQDTQNTIVDDFRTHLQNWENNTNSWKSKSYCKWQGGQVEGFYVALESMWQEKGNQCGWGYYANPAGGFLACWLSREQGSEFNRIGTADQYADIFMQIHDATRLTVRLAGGNTGTITSPFMWQVFGALEKISNETSDDIQIEKAGRFKGGWGAAVANVKFGGQEPWFAIDTNGIVNMEATIERLFRVQELIQKVAKHLTDQEAVKLLL